MLNIKKGEQSFVDLIIILLTTFLFSSFFLFNMSQAGAIILAVTTALILLFIALKNHGKLYIKFSEFHYCVIYFILYCLITCLWARNTSAVIEKVVTLTEILICMTVLYSYFSLEKTIAPMLDVIKWGGFIVATYTIIVYGLSELRAVVALGGRFGTTFANINSVTLLSALSAVLIIYELINRRSRNIWEITLLLPEILVIAAGGSRKAFVFLLAGLAMCVLVRFSSKNIFITVFRWIIVGAFLVMLLQFIISLPFFSGIQDRMKGLVAAITGSGKIDSSTRLREMYIQLGLEQFRKTPLFGIGIGNSSYITAAIGENTYLHNNFVELLACGGIVGFLFYYGMHIKVFKNFIKLKASQEEFGYICIILLILLTLMDFGQVSYYTKQTYFYLMMMFVEVKILKDRKESEGSSHEFKE